MLCYITLHYILLYHIILHYITLHSILLYYIILCYIILYYIIISYYIILYYIILWLDAGQDLSLAREAAGGLGKEGKRRGLGTRREPEADPGRCHYCWHHYHY